jgi:integrase
MKERRRAARKTPVTPSQQERNQQRAANPADHIGEFYDRNSYRKAVGYAIRLANKAGHKIQNWSPYQLRHAQATDLEKREGLDKAQAVLRHTTANTTRRYAHAQLAIAEDVAKKRVNPFADDSTGLINPADMA